MSKDLHIVFQVLNFLKSDASLTFSLTPAEQILYIFLASHRGKKGIYPSISTLSKETKLSSRQCTRITRKLESIGLILITKTDGRSNKYSITLPEIDKSYPQTPDTHVRGDTPDTPDTHVTPPLTPMSDTPDTGVRVYKSKEEIKRNSSVTRAGEIQDSSKHRTYVTDSFSFSIWNYTYFVYCANYYHIHPAQVEQDFLEIVEIKKWLLTEQNVEELFVWYMSKFMHAGGASRIPEKSWQDKIGHNVGIEFYKSLQN